MKYLIAALFFFSGFSVQAQTNLRTVMVDTNGVVQRPTNFITANNLSPTNAAFNSGSFLQSIYQWISVNNSTETTNGTVAITNGTAYLTVGGTNANGMAGIRLIGEVNSRPVAGTGAQWGSDGHAMWIKLDANTAHGIIRFVLGNPRFPATGIGAYPTNRAIGLEVQNSGGTNQVRLIAHNGSTNTNGPWVNVGDVFQRYTFGVLQNKTSGQVLLSVGVNSSTITNNTNATITGGPTNSGGGLQNALDVAIFTTNTNANNASLNVLGALVEVSD